MTDFLQIVSSLREQMNASLSRSDVLKPLAWIIGILMLGIVGLAYAPKAPQWLLMVFAGLFVVACLLYGFAYVFCLLKDRDALRSEKYTLHKMAIEQGLLGDSRSGLTEPNDTVRPPSETPPLIERKP